MPDLSGGFFFDLFTIILIDILLGGDNAIVIAMAVRGLPAEQRKLGVAAGAGGAVVLRVILTFFAAQILQLNYIQLTGGLLILWVAVKLLTDSSAEEHKAADPSKGLRHAIWVILVADLTMSLDNILAVAAASHGSWLLLVIGLALSISFVVFTSNLLSRLMDRYPVVVWLGAAVLGRVGGDMIMTDNWVEGLLHPSKTIDVIVQIICAAGVLVVGMLMRKRRI